MKDTIRLKKDLVKVRYNIVDLIELFLLGGVITGMFLLLFISFYIHSP